jgi:hypothetical protein
MADFTMYKYENKVWSLPFVENGAAYPITGAAIYFALRKTPPPASILDDTDAVISKSTIEGSITITNGPAGLAQLTFVKANTLNVSSGDYYYAIKWVPNGQTEGRVVAAGIFTIYDDMVRTV